MSDLLKFYNEQFVPFWKRYSEIRNQSSDIAEKLFFDLMKIIITLSTGMLAFIVAISHGIELKYLIKFIVLFVIAIISAMFSFANSARNYKKEADSAGTVLHKAAKIYTEGKISELEDLIKNREGNILEEGYNVWHEVTIRLGYIAAFTFLLGVIWFIITLSSCTK